MDHPDVDRSGTDGEQVSCDEIFPPIDEDFFEYDRFGYPLAPETRARRALLRQMWEEHSKMTPAECRACLVKLGTHNPDGTLTEHYRDDGEPSKYRPTD
jgi:hypothetical protein